MLQGSRGYGDKEKKIIADRISWTENCFGELCSELTSYTKKEARLRDKYDELSVIFKRYGDSEEFNKSLAAALNSYSRAMTQLADVKEIQVQRLQSHTIREMAIYENICKTTREIVKHSIMMRDKDLTRKQHIDQIKQKTQARNQAVNGVIKEQNKAKNEAKSNVEVDENVINFEQQKLQDFKKILLDLTLIQMKWHAKSIDILTAVYDDVASIDIANDLKTFESRFEVNEQRSLKNQMRTQSLSALSTLNQQPVQTQRKLSSSTFSLGSPSKEIAEKINGRISPSNSVERNKGHSHSEGTSEESDTTSTSSDTNDDDDDDDDVDEDGNVREYDGNAYDSGQDEHITGKTKAIVHVQREPPVPQVRLSKQIANN